MKTDTLTPELIRKMDAYWRAANYLSIGQMYFDPTLFMRADEVEGAWQILMPMLGVWVGSNPRTCPNYVAGSPGPKTADELLVRAGHARRPIA